MGVMATYCQLCGLPVQHDHYVPTAGDMLEIYRSDPREHRAEGPTPVIAFGPEQAWLAQGVAVALEANAEPAIIEGFITDGWLTGTDDDDEGVMVMDGVDERAALHRACYDLVGKPTAWSLDDGLNPPDEIAAYQEQLFDFAGLDRDGLSWMLVDPRGTSAQAERSRKRIQERARLYRCE